MKSTLEDDEMVEILEGIARDSKSATAQIAAIKTLREMRGRQEPEQSGGVMDAKPRRTSHLRAV